MESVKLPCWCDNMPGSGCRAFIDDEGDLCLIDNNDGNQVILKKEAFMPLIRLISKYAEEDYDDP